MRPCFLRRQIGGLAPNSSPILRQRDLPALHAFIHIQCNRLFAAMRIEMNYARLVRARNSARPANRHPVFAEADALPGIEKRIRLLVAKQPCLHFRIRALVV